MVFTADLVWEQLLSKILLGHEYDPRGMPTKEIISNTTYLNMKFPIITNPVRRMGYSFMFAEAWWILSGRRDVNSIRKYVPDIVKFSNDGYQFDGAYGPRVMEQMRYVVDSLMHDSSTRQAVITIWRPNPRPSNDIPCTVSLQFLERNNEYGSPELHCIATMRSSDAWLGWVYDVFNFTMITAYVATRLNELRNYQVDLGTLYLTAGSQHLYERHWDMTRMALEAGPAVALPEIDVSAFNTADKLIDWLDWAKDNVKHKLKLDTEEYIPWKVGLQKLNGLYESRK